MGGEKKELVDEVVALSKRYGIVTPYTSYLVTEDTPQVAIREPRPNEGRMPLQAPPPPPVFSRPGWGQPQEERGAMAPSSPPRDRPMGGAVPATASAAPEREMQKSEARMDMYRRKGTEVGKTDSGESAVQYADAVKDLKTADNEPSGNDEAAGIRFMEGRTFRYQGGAWVDVEFSASMKTLKLKYLGKAYYSLLWKSDKLRHIFTLGRELTIVVGPNLALVVSMDGKEEASDAELSPYIMK
jgi:Ca-activated chloride channel family protein